MEREREERERERECSGDTFPDRAGVETMNRPTGVVPANLQAQRPHCHPCVPPSPRLVTAEGCFADLDGPVAIATAATANLSNLFSIHTALEHEFLRLLRNRAFGYASSDLSAIALSCFPSFYTPIRSVLVFLSLFLGIALDNFLKSLRFLRRDEEFLMCLKMCVKKGMIHRLFLFFSFL